MLTTSGVFYRLHDLASTAAAETRNITRKHELIQHLVDVYYGGVRATLVYKRAVNIAVHSLYIPAIFHWMKVLGEENVHVVRSEDLRAHATANIALEKIFRYAHRISLFLMMMILLGSSAFLIQTYLAGSSCQLTRIQPSKLSNRSLNPALAASISFANFCCLLTSFFNLSRESHTFKSLPTFVSVRFMRVC